MKVCKLRTEKFYDIGSRACTIKQYGLKIHNLQKIDKFCTSVFSIVSHENTSLGKHTSLLQALGVYQDINDCPLISARVLLRHPHPRGTHQGHSQPARGHRRGQKLSLLRS
jgi:hypothetical protein